MKKHIKNIKEKLSVHKTLIQNFSYLSALQVFNMLIPLITNPYLIRVLGKETYGLVVFAQAIIQYLVILVEFGFNISATKEVSIHRDNKKKISEIVSSVLLMNYPGAEPRGIKRSLLCKRISFRPIGSRYFTT